MRNPLALTFALLGLTCASVTAHADDAKPMTAADPYQWLEDVGGDKALDWVRERNAESASIKNDPAFKQLEADLRSILDSDARIPYVSKIGEHYYNFWKDAANPRGLWRRTSLAEYRKTTPAWEVVLDLDALNKAEGENWVWQGANCLKPAYARCLIQLSRGGADANVTREFDMPSKTFLADGFFRPEAKGSLSWIDQDSVYVATDFGPGSMTSSGYARIVKEWKRGTPMSDASVVYEGKADDLGVGAYRDDTPGFERDFVGRTLAFYNDELYLRGEDGALAKIDVPNSVQKSVYREWLLLELRQPWTVGAQSWPAGALVATRLEDFMAGKREFETLFEPTTSRSLAGVTATRNHLVLNVMDDVKNRLEVLTFGDTGWRSEPLKGAPTSGTLGLSAIDSDESDDYFLTVSDYLTPPTLMIGSLAEAPQPLKQMPAFFDASGFEINQHFAISKDGTRVPYFMVSKKNLPLDGSNPTLLYGYGGFEVSLTPNYSAGAGRGWLQVGGVYVVANIRGGGEYGPGWHQAALKANRLRAFEDFAAVAEDLVERKVTAPQRLGIQGGSNGGLLVGNMVTMYPEHFAAAVCQVPLLDMQRYHLLLAGASWMAEFGDPDKPEEWEFIKTYSPYHNVEAGKKYPAVLFTTSTRDDRVHPGHARKMLAKMKSQEHEVYYYENIEGGHGGAADNGQLAHMQALAYTFLRQQLMAPVAADKPAGP